MPIIEVTHLAKRYGEHVAVRDVSFSVAEGEIFGIVGRNGAGKTTTVECVAGLRRPDSGTIVVDGLDPREDRAELTRRLGVQLQSSALPDRITVREAVRMFASFHGHRVSADALIEQVGLGEKRDARYGRLSGGQKQRLSIALALVGAPRVAILDELTTGLDPQARRDTWELIEQIRDQGITVVLVTHFMEEAERLCDRVALIHGGVVAALDTPAGLIRRAGVGERVTFTPSAPVDRDVLSGLDGVREVVVDRRGRVVVTGDVDVTGTVVAELAGAGVRVTDLRVERPTLDAAFLALTGAPAEAA
ncbi:ABC transporter ATP-binding protein [Thermopolyspora flexuosa]|jgi:ABC-2 type transport system ATP-binding protein|uniref:ABC-2 type transport system ATP-binding protein n=1 Tax=Thermopolyspora flexuosa TaxID=103836 RepID=A0A543IPW0_9ACTN|nr:ABC transporter ATP-binding protein [Thermopolyspora flexuosa]TQM72611.1 ABC-2 type transport system ATP-binding protein [Thermopolyspora flexuosa]